MADIAWQLLTKNMKIDKILHIYASFWSIIYKVVVMLHLLLLEEEFLNPLPSPVTEDLKVSIIW